MDKLIAYTRRSRERANGFGLADQERKIREWAAYRGVEVVDVLADDDTSGRAQRHERPALEQALSMVESEAVSGIVVAKFDRLSRSIAQFAALLDRACDERWSLVCLEPEIDTTTSTGRAFAQMIAVFAEFERAQYVERMLGGKMAKRAAGGWIGGTPPFGWCVEDDRLVRDDDEQLVRRRMQGMKRRGLSLRAIASKLDAEGVAPRRGGSWHATTVARALKRRQA